MSELRSPSVAELVRSRFSELTPAERKVARTLLNDYPIAGLQPIARLALASAVSGPTVLRLAARLGFSGWPDVQAALKSELGTRLSSPLELYPVAPHRDQNIDDQLSRIGQAVGEHVRSSLAGIPAADWEAALRLLTDSRRRVLVTGGRFSHVLAQHLGAHLRILRPAVAIIGHTCDARSSAVLDVGRRDTVVVFDFRRYQPDVVAFGEAAKAQSAAVVLVTDQYLSPLSAAADVVLMTSIEAPSPFDSLTPAFALVEAMIAAVVRRLGDRPRSRLARFESLTKSAGARWDAAGGQT